MSERSQSSVKIPTLMIVTDRKHSVLPLAELARRSVRGGVDGIQIREKDLAPKELFRIALEVMDAVGNTNPVVINGSLEAAAAAGAGLHLPEAATFDLEQIRCQLAPGSIVGRSVHSPREAERSTGFDYLIAGPFSPTSSKPGAGALGVERLRHFVESSACPVLAIGGIDEHNAAEAMTTGIHGVAVMSRLGQSDNPEETARCISNALRV